MLYNGEAQLVFSPTQTPLHIKYANDAGVAELTWLLRDAAAGVGRYGKNIIFFSGRIAIHGLSQFFFTLICKTILQVTEQSNHTNFPIRKCLPYKVTIKETRRAHLGESAISNRC